MSGNVSDVPATFPHPPTSDLVIAENRRQMGQFLEERMTRTYSKLSERQELEPDTALVKTYVVEAHPVDAADGGRAFWQQVLRDESMAARFAAELHASDEGSLITLDGTFEGREPVSIFVDMAPGRFWKLHTLASSRAIDWILGRAIKSGPTLDQTWIPAQLLEDLTSLGSFRGLGLDFDRRVIGDVDFEQADAPLEFLKMQLWGTRARRVLEVLREEEAFPDSTTLSKVKLKYWPDPDDPDQFTLDDIKFDGKITARGSSFGSHLGLVDYLLNSYRRRIVGVEERYSMSRATEREGLVIRGEPLFFSFRTPISDLDAFCDGVFSSSEPFRLWGVPHRTSPAMVRVRAVDLHVGARLDFEVTQDFIRLFLPLDTCGNTVLRFYTNLQRYFDSRVTLTTGGGEDVLELQP